MTLHSALEQFVYHARTIFLFTKADIQTTFLPIFFFGLAAAPVASLSGLLHSGFWLWLHLLHFDVANQIYAVEEDTMNKPHRPLPAKRISLRNATIFRWALIPVCFAMSTLYSVQALYTSIAFAVLTFIYNELHADAGFWLLRNTVNGLGFAAFEWGTTLLAGTSWKHIDSAAALAIFHSAAILTTTIQVQDFKDVIGDAHVGRRTFPLVSESWARISVIATLLPWSIALAQVWKLDAVPAGLFILLGTIIGFRFLLYRSVPEDRTSYKVYNIWLSCSHILVGYWRYMSAA